MREPLGVVPDLVDPALEDLETIRGHPLSRKQFKELTRWDWTRVLDYEKLAILCIEDYAQTILVRDSRGQLAYSHGKALKTPLTPYHQWVLREIRKLFERGLKEPAVEAILDRDSYKYTFENYLRYLNAKSQDDKRRQQRRYYEQKASATC